MYFQYHIIEKTERTYWPKPVEFESVKPTDLDEVISAIREFIPEKNFGVVHNVKNPYSGFDERTVEITLIPGLTIAIREIRDKYGEQGICRATNEYNIYDFVPFNTYLRPFDWSCGYSRAECLQPLRDIYTYVINTPLRSVLLDHLSESFAAGVNNTSEFVKLIGKAIGKKIRTKHALYSALHGEQEFYSPDPVPTDLGERIVKLIETDPLNYIHASAGGFPDKLGYIVERYAREVINRD